MRQGHPPPRGRAYHGLALCLGSLTAIGPLAIDMYLPSFPAMAAEMATSVAAVQVSLAAYFAGIALGQAFYGPLSDRVGRRPALCIGLSVFTLASAGCALSSGVQALTGWRFMQALGGCAPIVVPRAVVRDYFDQRGSVRMLSQLMLVMGLAPILAPLIGGQLLIRFGWRSVFWVLAAYGGALTVLVLAVLRESLHPERRQRQSLGEVLGVYARLARDPRYLWHVVTGGLVFAGLLAYISASPHVFIELYHVPPERYGFYFGANAVGIITASQVNRWLAARAAPATVLRYVLPLAAASGLVMAFDAWTGAGGFYGLLVPLFCFIACYGFVLPNTTALAMAWHADVAGSASALLGTIQFVLGTLAGIAVGALSGTSALPLAGVIAACGICGWAVFVAADAAAIPAGRR